jgi:RNA polymerase sigma factor (sigma-70 family)
MIEHARAGDTEAWRRLFEWCQPRLLSDAQRLLGPNWDKISPRDLTQETWLKAQRGIAGYQGHGFLSWLSAIMRNVYRNARRRKSLRGQALHTLLVSGIDATGLSSDGRPRDEPAATETSASRLLLEQERALLLREALSTLEPHTREILRMSAEDTKLSFREIGARLGLSEKQVTTRYHRGLAQLKTKLKSLRE